MKRRFFFPVQQRVNSVALLQIRAGKRRDLGEGRVRVGRDSREKRGRPSTIRGSSGRTHPQGTRREQELRKAANLIKTEEYSSRGRTGWGHGRHLRATATLSNASLSSLLSFSFLSFFPLSQCSVVTSFVRLSVPSFYLYLTQSLFVPSVRSRVLS